MTFSIEDKTAIVTGAANGIGLAIARQFVDQGAKVMFADMDGDSLSEEVAGLDGDGNAQVFVGDLRKKLTQANLLSATLDAFGRVDILVNASRQVMATDPLDMDDSSLGCLIEQNLMAGYRLSQTIANRMIKQAKKDENAEDPVGTIVNISSIASQRVHPDLLAYSVSTAALDQVTRALAVALAPERIRVNAVAFGSVMSESLRTELANSGDAREEIIGHTPLGRIAEARDLAETVQFLASDAANFMTGQVLTVDGGRTLLDAVDAAAH